MSSPRASQATKRNQVPRGMFTVLYGLGLLLSGWVPEVNAVARKVGLGQWGG